MADTTCIACGCTFSIVPAKLRNGKGKYCKLECRNASAGYRKQIRAALPGTIAEIAARSGIHPDTVRHQLVALQRRGEAHAGHLVVVPADQRGRGSPAHAIVYAAGEGVDADVPLMPRAALAHLYRAALLRAMPATQTEMVERTGQSQGGVSRVTHELHGAGLCHITSWRRGRGGAVPVYTAGPGKDRVCRIEPYTPAQRSKRYINKLERRGLLPALRARNAADQRAVTLRKNGDPLVVALFGKGRAANKETA